MQEAVKDALEIIRGNIKVKITYIEEQPLPSLVPALPNPIPQIQGPLGFEPPIIPNSPINPYAPPSAYPGAVDNAAWSVPFETQLAMPFEGAQHAPLVQPLMQQVPSKPPELTGAEKDVEDQWKAIWPYTTNPEKAKYISDTFKLQNEEVLNNIYIYIYKYIYIYI